MGGITGIEPEASRSELQVDGCSRGAETGSGTLVARRHDLSPSLVNRWVRKYRALGEAAFDARVRAKRAAAATVADLKELRVLERENAQLKKLLAEKELENAVLRDLVKKTRLP